MRYAIPLLLAGLALPLGAAAIPDQCLRPPTLDSGSPGITSELVYSKLFAEAISQVGLGVKATPPVADHVLGFASGSNVWAYVANSAGCILTFGHVSRADWDMAKKLTFPPPPSSDGTLTLRGQDEIIPDFKRKQPGGPS